MNIKDTMWATSPAAKPILPLGLQSFLAIVFVLVALVSSGAFLVTSSKAPAVALLNALVASCAIGLGAVYVVNAVHVYTG